MTEDEAFDEVRQFVAAGEYCDDRYIRIGPMAELPRRAGRGWVGVRQ